MMIRKKIVFYFTMLLIGIAGMGKPLAVFAEPEEPNTIHAKGAVLVEQDSMRILWERDAHTPLPMASTTKIMTCILALEEGNLSDVVTTSKRAAAAPKVKLYLRPDEKQYLGDLLYALMLQSSNDAAVAIAEHVGGSVEGFCQMMTEKAKELGARSTCFKTPNGLDAPGHMSSPYDLALITKYAYENPDFLQLIQTPAKHIPSSPLEGSRPHDLQNKNRFLTSYEGANGVKTGYTGLAGHCFVGGARQDDMQLFAVVLASGWGPNGNKRKYSDTSNLLEYGFNNYQMVEVKSDMDQIGTLPVILGEEDLVTIAYGKGLRLPLNKEEEGQVSVTFQLPQEIAAPIKDKQVVGKAKVYVSGSLEGTLPIVARSAIDKRRIKSSWHKTIQQWINLLYD